jgi:hypothetical protein
VPDLMFFSLRLVVLDATFKRAKGEMRLREPVHAIRDELVDFTDLVRQSLGWNRH